MPYIPGKGTTIATSSGAIAQCVTIKPPGITVDSIDVSHLESAWTEKTVSIPDGGELGFTFEHDVTADHTGLLDTVLTTQTSEVRTWTITLNSTLGADPPLITAAGHITGLDFGELAIDNVLIVDVTVTITGAVTVA